MIGLRNHECLSVSLFSSFKRRRLQIVVPFHAEDAQAKQDEHQVKQAADHLGDGGDRLRSKLAAN